MKSYDPYNTTDAKQCMDEGEYALDIYLNGSLQFTETFHPSPFQPGNVVIGISDDSILPSIPGNEANTSIVTITGKVVDNISRSDYPPERGYNCAKGVKGAPVRLYNQIVSKSGSHLHFNTASEVGTGDYISSTPTWSTISTDKTDMTMSSGEGGIFIAKYQAGEFGVSETVTATITNPETGQEVSTDHQFDIKVAGLVPLDTSGATYTISGSGNPGCDLGHNKSATERSSHYLTPATHGLVQNLNDAFYTETGINLNINDASLEFGGFFDSGDRNTACHKSHRTGNDFDVNTGQRWWVLKDTGEAFTEVVTKDNRNLLEEVHPDCVPEYGYNLNCLIPYGPLNVPTIRRDILDENAKHIGLQKIQEDTIHYRFAM